MRGHTIWSRKMFTVVKIQNPWGFQSSLKLINMQSYNDIMHALVTDNKARSDHWTVTNTT